MSTASTASAAPVPNLYRHSGEFSMFGLTCATAGGIVVAVALAWVYVAVEKWIPLIYANVLACVGFGAAVGASTAWILRFFKCRNTFLCLALSLLIGAVALLASWDIWVYLLIEEEEPGALPLMTLATRPDILLGLILEINEVGTWSLGHSKEAVTGLALWACWLVEAALVLGFAYYFSRKMNDGPFCEACKTWCSKVPKLPGVKIGEVGLVRQEAAQFAVGDYSAIVARGRRAESDPHWLDLDVRKCPRCGATITLTVQYGVVRENRGKAETKLDMLVDKALISPEQLTTLQAAFAPPENPAELLAQVAAETQPPAEDAT